MSDTQTAATASEPGVELHPTPCAICGTYDAATVVYPANFTAEAFNAAVFSARRLPDCIHYRLMRCDACGLMRSDPVADPGTLARLYKESTFDYGTEVESLKSTYGRYLTKCLVPAGGKPGSLLEVGCGNGFLLEEAVARGFGPVNGVEPSEAAVAQATDAIRPRLVCDILRPGLFEPASFDGIAMFQVFDHLPDPAGALDTCLELLKPGGRLLLFNHDTAAWSAKLLGEKSPIIDIEHTYLYDPATLRKIAEKHGFRHVDSGAAWNGYSLGYVARLVPLPRFAKVPALKLLSATGIGRIPLRVPLGNQYLVAEKP